MKCFYCKNEHGPISDVVCPIFNRWPAHYDNPRYMNEEWLYVPLKKYDFTDFLKTTPNMKFTKDFLVEFKEYLEDVKDFANLGVSRKGKQIRNNILFEVVAHENKEYPFTDAQIHDFLKESGIVWNENVISKYRKNLGIPNAFRRMAKVQTHSYQETSSL